MNASELDLVRSLVLRKSGIVLEAEKQYLIEARLSVLAKKVNAASPSAIVAQLRQPGASDLERLVVEAMTTNETSFLRDVHPFEALKKAVLPEIIARRAQERKLAIWCAASSTGQEPYTLAMLIREHFPQLASWNITFIASDLSRDVLDRARAGRYSQLEVNRGLPASLLVKYFNRDGLVWEIIPELRRMIDFREINLLEAWPIMPPLDLVFIRNVLIYFSNDTKKTILRRIRGLMRKEAYLFLGGAETTLNIDDNFDQMKLERSGCYRLKAAAIAEAA